MSHRKDVAAKCEAAVCPSLFIKKGKRYSPLTASTTLESLRAWAAAGLRQGTEVLKEHRAVELFLLSKFARLYHEVFAVVLLDRHYRLIDYVELAHGSREMVHVKVREIVKLALAREAAAVILAHNHPSSNTEPSEAALTLTRRVRDALKPVDVELLDHFIIGDRLLSFRQRGLLLL